MKKFKGIFSLMVLTLFFSSFSVAESAILRPYVVDQKEQVLFGDSLPVYSTTTDRTYYGLENYVQDYVGGYAHISFTYTHASGGYAGYPPVIYTTDIDPTLVSNYTAKHASTAFHLGPGHPTDWYLYDIQFSETGHTVSVKRAGIEEIFSEVRINEYATSTDWAFVANHYPADPPNSHSMSFAPFRIKEKVNPAEHSSVLFIPGFMASRLYSASTGEKLWEPLTNSDIDGLMMANNGASINSVYSDGALDSVTYGFFKVFDIYKSFYDEMNDLEDENSIEEWLPFHYDWRFDVYDIVYVGTEYEDGRKQTTKILQDLINESGNGKVTIVAHSNGGLIAKMLLKKLQDDKNSGVNNLIDRIDNIILVGSPQIGTPDSISSIVHGFGRKMFGGVIVSESQARELGRKMSGAYGLLPSMEYINITSEPVVKFKDHLLADVTDQFINFYGEDVDSYVEYKDFLFGNEGRVNPTTEETKKPIKLLQDIFNRSENFHNLIDSLVIPDHIRVVEVAGWGIDTIASFEYYPKFKKCVDVTEFVCGPESYVLDARPVFTIDGDRTVVVLSAHNISGAEKYFVNLNLLNDTRRGIIKHDDIFEVDYLNNLIKSVLFEEDVVLNNIISTSTPKYLGDRLRLSVHSPITISAYDIAGNFTGKVCPAESDFCYIQEDIPNSSYLEFGEGKYLNIPEEELSKVVLQGTDIGTFTFESEKVLSDGTSTTTVFADIPVTSQTLAEMVLNTNGDPMLKVDVTGDGVYDFVFGEVEAFDPILYLEMMKETIKSLDLNKSKKNNLIKRIDKVINLIEKGKIDKAELRVEKFTSSLEKRIDKKDPKKPKPGRLTKDDAEKLLEMLENLLNNLD